jgi:FAD/FMN-containing dehydrogenase
MNTNSASRPAVDPEALASLRVAMRGPVVTPSDPDYDAIREIWNASIDRRPAVVARPSGVADVVAAVRFGVAHDLDIAVRGGGHSFAGLGTCDDGLVIDLGLMKGVRVDEPARTVTAQGGVTWGDLDHETAVFGLATTGGLVSTTGIAGLTLGGGIGWLMRKHGLACDNLVGADVVTGDGQVVHASETEHADLFWALRGGGGNFGVVTSLEYRLHPVATVYGGMLLYPAEYASEVLAYYDKTAHAEPDELCSLLEFATAPDMDGIDPASRGESVIALALCHCGPIAEGEAALQPWRDLAPLAADFVEAMPYTSLQQMYDEDFPRGLWSYMKSHYVDELTTEVVDLLVDAGKARPPGRSFIDVHHMEGAPVRVAPDATAFDQRHARYTVMFGGVAEDAEGMTICRDWARTQWAALAPYASGHTYVNFMTDADATAVNAAYSAEKYERLVAVKDRYDPTNRFHINHNIVPAAP